MKLHPEWREFIELLNSRGVEYLVVGAHALSQYGRPRFTGDLDIFVRRSPENAVRLMEVLAAFGFGNVGLSAADFEKEDQVVQLGFPPVRIDLLTSLTGISFEEAWISRQTGTIDAVPVAFPSREVFLKNKRATGRGRDQGDVASLGED